MCVTCVRPPLIRRDIDNEAAWVYLAALHSPRARVAGGSAPQAAGPGAGGAGAGTRAQAPAGSVAAIARDALEVDPECRFALEALADWNEAAAQRCVSHNCAS